MLVIKKLFIFHQNGSTPVVSNKQLEEFQSQITVLSKVRHRHLVSLLGYCIEGNKRLLVYQYMPKGVDLSRHIFDLANNGLEPIS